MSLRLKKRFLKPKKEIKVSLLKNRYHYIFMKQLFLLKLLFLISFAQGELKNQNKTESLEEISKSTASIENQDFKKLKTDFRKGLYYFKKKNYKQALQYFQKSAEQGNLQWTRNSSKL